MSEKPEYVRVHEQYRQRAGGWEYRRWIAGHEPGPWEESGPPPVKMARYGEMVVPRGDVAVDVVRPAAAGEDGVDPRPLHVRVAEAIGWKDVLVRTWSDDRGQWFGTNLKGEMMARIPRYDTDWSATGPLIERYVTFVERVNETGPVAWGARWSDPMWDVSELFENGPTPLIAVCNLILALKEAGKLEEQVTA